jgi:FtsZ-binding cell division protein ZapB
MDPAVQRAGGIPEAESGTPEQDPLESLEDRIRRAAELVASLRAERDAALAERDAALKAAAPALAEAQKLRLELDGLRGERTQVRKRIEKLLGQMDLLSGS